MYLLTAKEATTLDIDRMRAQLGTMGGSVLVVGDSRVARVRLHSERPDLAIVYGLRRGTVSRGTVENMDLLSAGEREERAADLLGVPVSALDEASVPEARVPVAIGESPRVPFAVVAVVVGSGIVEAFRAAGVTAMVPGGQGEDPSTGELLAAIEAACADAVVLLPNDPNVRLAAVQAATLAHGTAVHVVQTRNAAEGLAAVLAADPRAEPAANAARMARAAAAIRTFVVTTAVRDAIVNGRAVKRGHAIALDPDDGLIATGPDRVRVAVDAVAVVADGAELLTIHQGADASLEEAERFAALFQAAFPALVVEIVRGGQPHHAFLVAAE